MILKKTCWAAVISVILTQSTFAGPAIPGKFTDSVTGLSFRLPSGWIELEKQYPPVFLSDKKSGMQDYMLLDKYFRDVSVEEAFDKYWEHLQKAYDGIEMVEHKEIELKDKKFIRLLFTYKNEKDDEEDTSKKRIRKGDPDGTKRMYMLFIKTGSIINILEFYNNTMPAAEAGKILDKLAATISFDSAPKVIHSLFSPKGNDIEEMLKSKKYEEALKLANKELEINKEDAQLMMLKAEAYAYLGEEEKALVQIEAALTNGFYSIAEILSKKAFATMVANKKMEGILGKRKQFVKKGRMALLARAKKEMASYYEIRIPETNVTLFSDIKDNAAIKILKESMVTTARFAREGLAIVPNENSILWIMSASRDVNKALIGTLMGTSANFEGVYVGSFGIFFSDTYTGYGTFVHEYMHALHSGDQEAVLQKHPRWLTEMLSTTFETLRWNHVLDIPEVELKSERLTTLCLYIREGKHVGFDKLISAEDGWTEGIEIGLFYAAVRYIGVYLYQKGLLGEFYKEYKKNYANDRSGRLALEKVTGKKLEVFEKEWEMWAATLASSSVIP